MNLQPASEACHAAVIIDQADTYDKLKLQIAKASETGLRGVAIASTLHEEQKDELRERGYIIVENPDLNKADAVGYRLVILW